MPTCAIAYSGKGRLAAAVARVLRERKVPVVGIVDRPRASREALESLDIPVYQIENTPAGWSRVCIQHRVECIALAGFLLPVPAQIVQQYKGRIINSHPALLPAFGGKGMYGRRVHESVVAAGCEESGFTVHEVSERYDEGPILHQVRLPIRGLDVETVEAFIQAAEREVYPMIVWRLWRTCVSAESSPL
ncbi:MAG: formyltransferase family protein [Bacteroidia bacterium]|nr:formyltransferase family protein [Bacteroidia bacterium]